MYLDIDKLKKDAEKLEEIESNLTGGADRTKTIATSAKLKEVTGVDTFIQSECANELSRVYDDYGELETTIKKIIELWLKYLSDAGKLDNYLASLTGGQPVYGPPQSPSLSITDYNVSPSDYNVSLSDYTYSMSDYNHSASCSLTADEKRYAEEKPNNIEPQLIYAPPPLPSMSYDWPIPPWSMTHPNPFVTPTWPEYSLTDIPWTGTPGPGFTWSLDPWPTWTEYSLTENPWPSEDPLPNPDPQVLYAPPPLPSWTYTMTENPWPSWTYTMTENPLPSWTYTMTENPLPSWTYTMTENPWPSEDPLPNPDPQVLYAPPPLPSWTYTMTENPWPVWSPTDIWPITPSISSIAPWQITPSYDIPRPSLINPDPNGTDGNGIDLDDLMDRLGGTKGGSGKDDNKSNSTKKGLSANISDALKRGSNLLTGGLIPTSGKTSGSSKTGGLVAGGLGLGAAAIAGGLLLNAKMKFIYFKPSDFDRQDEETQNAIIGDLTEAGLNEAEILEFKNATFKVLNSELNPHVKKAEQAFNNNPNFDNEVKEMYGFHIFANADKLDKYLLFVAMIIDGVNTTDETNLYNLINPNLDENELDFIYSGINMYEYMVTEDEVIEEEELEGEYAEESQEQTPSIEETDPEALQALEMLKDMGVDIKE